MGILCYLWLCRNWPSHQQTISTEPGTCLGEIYSTRRYGVSPNNPGFLEFPEFPEFTVFPECLEFTVFPECLEFTEFTEFTEFIYFTEFTEFTEFT